MTEAEAKYLKLARRAREESNAEDAEKYYDMVRTENPDNAEARLYYAYYHLWGGIKRDWYNNYMYLTKVVVPVTKQVIEEGIEGVEKETFLSEMISSIAGLPDTCCDVLRDIGQDDSSARRQIADSGLNMFLSAGDLIEKAYPDDTRMMQIALSFWEAAFCIRNGFAAHLYLPKEQTAEYTAKIKKLDPEFVTYEERDALEKAAREKAEQEKKQAQADMINGIKDKAKSLFKKFGK